ncbi:MAG: rRNA maturation RNase YbeY [Candidatus Omnitrophota bacterium]
MNPVRNMRYPRNEKISNGVKVTIRNSQKTIPIDWRTIKKATLKVLSSQSKRKSGEINLCFVSDKKIKQLNLLYLGKNEPTDVISFDLTEAHDAEKKLFADIIISADTALSNSKIFKTDPLYEIHMYVVHGLLHLLGYDDGTLKQRKRMEQKTKQILRTL